MTGFEPQTKSVGSDRSANWATPLPYKLNFVILNYRCTAGHQFAWNGFTKQENMLFFVCCKADKLGTILPPMVSVLWAKRHETRSQERYWRYWLVSALKLTVFF